MAAVRIRPKICLPMNNAIAKSSDVYKTMRQCIYRVYANSKMFLSAKLIYLILICIRLPVFLWSPMSATLAATVAMVI